MLKLIFKTLKETQKVIKEEGIKLTFKERVRVFIEDVVLSIYTYVFNK